jgi:hypothetical protein
MSFCIFTVTGVAQHKEAAALEKGGPQRIGVAGSTRGLVAIEEQQIEWSCPSGRHVFRCPLVNFHPIF